MRDGKEENATVEVAWSGGREISIKHSLVGSQAQMTF